MMEDRSFVIIITTTTIIIFIIACDAFDFGLL
jgi:hypothetical protein